MIQIFLYVALSAIAIFLYVLNRSRRPDNAKEEEPLVQQRLENLLEKISLEQAELVKSVNQKMGMFQKKIEELEKKIQEQEDNIKHIQSNPQDSFRLDEKQMLENSEQGLELSPKHAQVLKLLRETKDERDIARQTGVGIGEIELLQRLLLQQDK